MSHSRVSYLPRLPADLALALFELAENSARQATRAGIKKIRAKRSAWQTLHPGPDTPLWNELVRQAKPLLARRGSKAALARLLGIPRQRLHVCLTSPSACLDAERALLLLCWVSAKKEGRDLLGG
jgi:hypothetical protein